MRLAALPYMELHYSLGEVEGQEKQVDDAVTREAEGQRAERHGVICHPIHPVDYLLFCCESCTCF